MWTRALSEVSASDVVTAGGKGASLGEMMRAGIPVPDGFVVLAGAFDACVHEGRDGSVEVSVPSEIAFEVLASFDALEAPFVAVRSSATAEDGAKAAWAGQLETYLYTTRETLMHNIMQCWQSLFSARATAYRAHQGQEQEEISVAVVVQKMVPSEVSGVAFSLHPVTGSREHMVIEAAYGLGEAVVSGEVTPDMYIIEKATGKVLEATVHEQDRQVGEKARGGTEWLPVPEKIRGEQKLSADDIAELALLVGKIERYNGFPCDVEWAKSAGRFFILQSRPITTVSCVLSGP